MMQGPPGVERRPAAPAPVQTPTSGYAPPPGSVPLPLAPKQKTWVMPLVIVLSVVVITLIIVVVILLTGK
jgi:hypothetical protein